MKGCSLFKLIIFIALNISSILGNGLTILDPPELSGNYLSGPLRTYTEQFNVTAEVSCYPSLTALCEEGYLNENSDKFRDTIVLVKIEGNSYKNVQSFVLTLERLLRSSVRSHKIVAFAQRRWRYFTRPTSMWLL